MNGCPYLEVNDFGVVCKATDWGKGLDGSQKYGPLPRSMIFHCSGKDHPTCSTYRRQRIRDVRNERWPDTT